VVPFHGSLLHARLQPELEALLLEDLMRGLGDFQVHSGQDPVQASSTVTLVPKRFHTLPSSNPM
jgi:hypothetical protein